MAIIFDQRGRPVDSDNPFPVTAFGSDGVEGVTIKGSNRADGELVNGVSFEVDEDGYAALRVVDAAPIAYDEANDQLKVKQRDPIVTLLEDATVVELLENENAYYLENVDVSAFRTINVAVRWSANGNARHSVQWNTSAVSLISSAIETVDGTGTPLTFSSVPNRLPQLRRIEIRNLDDATRNITNVSIIGVR